jgi:hypothetical protein
VEELGDDDACLVGDVDARIRDAIDVCFAGLDLVVQNSVFANDRRVEVREQPVGNLLLLGELRENLLVVVRDRVDLDPGRLKLPIRIAQLTELRPARGSPDRRSIEDHDGFRVPATFVKVDQPSICVRKTKVGESLPDLGPRRMSIGKSRSCRRSKRGGRIESMVIAFNSHPRPLERKRVPARRRLGTLVI